MDTKEILEILRVYRHDLMNDLQIIQGYASMGKYERSNEKIQSVVRKLNSERQLQTIEAPQFIYWLLTKKLFDRQIHIDYQVNTSQSKVLDDEQMKNDGDTLLELIKENVSTYDLLYMDIEIKYADEWNIKYRINGQLEHDQGLMESVKNTLNHCLVIVNEESYEFVFRYK